MPYPLELEGHFNEVLSLPTDEEVTRFVDDLDDFLRAGRRVIATDDIRRVRSYFTDKILGRLIRASPNGDIETETNLFLDKFPYEVDSLVRRYRAPRSTQAHIYFRAAQGISLESAAEHAQDKLVGVLVLLSRLLPPIPQESPEEVRIVGTELVKWAHIAEVTERAYRQQSPDLTPTPLSARV